jgi:hypothetical protein
MNMILRIGIFATGLTFSFTIIKLLINKKLSERISLLWLFGALCIFIISLSPQIVDKIAKMIGVDYPPTIIFLIGIMVLLLVSFFHSIQISTLNSQIRELTQILVIKDMEASKAEDTGSTFKNIEWDVDILNKEEKKINANI